MKEKPTKKAFPKKRYIMAAAAILAVIIGVTVLRITSLNAYKANAVAIPKYPEKQALTVIERELHQAVNFLTALKVLHLNHLPLSYQMKS